MARRRDQDEGAVLVETALVGIVLLTLLFGVIELGLAWQDDRSVSSATRAGARTGSNAGNDRLADYKILQTLRDGLARFSPDQILAIVVYEPATADDAVPPDCTTGTPVSGTCNVYTAADLTRPASDFGGTTRCTDTAPDRFWCPSDREVAPDVYVGVWVKVRHEYLTGLFGSGVTITHSAVVPAEPAQ